jgi:hypothetical protein
VSVPELVELLVEPVDPVLSLECMSEHAPSAAKPKAAAVAIHNRVFMRVYLVSRWRVTNLLTGD